MNNREINVESFEYGIDHHGDVVIVSGEFMDGEEYLSDQDILNYIMEYGMPEEAFEILQQEDEGLTYQERNV